MIQFTKEQRAENQYKKELSTFINKNPRLNEKLFIEWRIKAVKSMLLSCEETADFNKGEYLDGITYSSTDNGGLLITSTFGSAGDYATFSEELEFLRTKLINILEPKPAEPKQKDYQKEVWFLTGVKLANGEAYQLRSENLSFRDIAEQLGFKATDQVYFSQSIGGSSKDSKNIFCDINRLKKIVEHCEHNNIEIDPKFLKECTNKYPNEF